MIRNLILLILFIGLCTAAFSQQKIKAIHSEKLEISGESKELKILYTYKTNKEGKKDLRVKFKNKTKSALEIDLVMGFYSNGVLLEKTTIVDCLKKSFLDNFLRPIHLVQSDGFQKNDIEVKVLNLIASPTDECRETHSQ